MTAWATVPWINEDEGWADAWARRPKLRGWFHAGAAAIGVPATMVAAQRAPEGRVRTSIAVFGAGYTTMLGASAAYHRLARSPAQARWLRRVDHAAIFAAIAGTWTPIAVIVLPPPATPFVLAGVWASAGAAAVTKLITLEGQRDHVRWAYMVLGWAAVGVFPWVWTVGGWLPLAEILAGGVAYSAGAALMRAKWWEDARWFGTHEAWHVAVLAGGTIHAVAIAQLVRATQPQPLSTAEKLRQSIRRPR